MPKKNISKKGLKQILGAFQPAIFPILKNAFPLKEFISKAMPAYACNMPHGVEIVIRKGFPYINLPSVIIRNVNFKEKFKTLFQEIAVRRLTVHAVVNTRIFTDLHLIEILADPAKKLPADITIHLNISTYEKSEEPLTGQKCVEISQAVFGSGDQYIPKVVPAIFSEIKSLSELEELAEMNYANSSRSRGMLVVSKKGIYKQGKVSILDSNISIFTPTETVSAVIEYINDSAKMMRTPDNGTNALRGTADSIVFKLGHKLLELEISELPLSLRSYFSQYYKSIAGKRAVIEIVNLPGQKRPIINRLIKIRM